MPEVEHELHQRRKSRNIGTAIALLCLASLMGALTIVKLREQMLEREAEAAAAATAEEEAGE